MPEEPKKKSHISWRTAAILWASGVLTGVSYCSAATAAHVGDEASKTLFLVSTGFFLVGCAVGLFVVIGRLDATE